MFALPQSWFESKHVSKGPGGLSALRGERIGEACAIKKGSDPDGGEGGLMKPKSESNRQIARKSANQRRAEGTKFWAAT